MQNSRTETFIGKLTNSRLLSQILLFFVLYVTYIANNASTINTIYSSKSYLKMLSLYLDTLIIGHKCCSMLNCRPVLHHCVVIFFWSSGIMECTCMLFTFENGGVLLMRQGASVVWHHSLPLMNSFNKTEAAVFSCRLCFPRAFPFISLILKSTYPWQCIDRSTRVWAMIYCNTNHIPGLM